MPQQDLFDPPRTPEPDLSPSRPLTMSERFRLWHEAHPDIYEMFKDLAFKLKSVGRTHYGSKSILEVIRYHRSASSAGVEEFKINNNFSSRYARMLIEEHPEFEGFFELRQLKTE